VDPARERALAGAALAVTSTLAVVRAARRAMSSTLTIAGCRDQVAAVVAELASQPDDSPASCARAARARSRSAMQAS